MDVSPTVLLLASASNPPPSVESAGDDNGGAHCNRPPCRQVTATVDLPYLLGRGLDGWMGVDGEDGATKDSDACWCDDWKESEPVGRLVFESGNVVLA